MPNFLPEFFAIASLHLLAVMSPGPDFVIVTKNSLTHSRKIGIYTALGLAFGIVIHIAYSLIGIGFIISKSILAFSVIKTLGAGYLIYIGYKALKAKPNKNPIDKVQTHKAQLTWHAALKMGFLTNVTNPKATLFFLALFTQVIHVTTPLWVKILYGIEMSTMTFLWFAFISLVLSHKAVQKPFARAQQVIERVTGAILIALGIKLLLAKAK